MYCDRDYNSYYTETHTWSKLYMSFVILLSTCVMYIIIIEDYIYNTVPLYTVYYIILYCNLYSYNVCYIVYNNIIIMSHDHE